MIVSSAGEAADPVGLPGAAGEDDHRQVRVKARGQAVGGPHAIQQVEPAAPFEHEVEHHEARLTDLDRA
ncbi:MAG TPA: hypothetical protein VI122_17820, partial [Thermoleophilaceae bacterium]